jgi:hypothetical protein
MRVPRPGNAPLPPTGSVAHVTGPPDDSRHAGCVAHLTELGYEALPAAADVREGITRVLEADFVVLLPRWEFNLASNVEVAVARALHLPVLDCTTLQRVVVT